ncbi:MAG: MoaD/ThiS family protein [Myxococcales bacterium]|nr:MoaD/ThiS family protein [Myxococcales bacterium]
MAAMPIVTVPPPFQGPTLGQGEIPVDGTTVRACLAAAEAKFPGFEAQIFESSGALRRFVKLFVNGEQIALAELDTEVGPDDEVAVITPIAGG